MPQESRLARLFVISALTLGPALAQAGSYGPTWPASRNPNSGAIGNYISAGAAVSANGRFIAFSSFSRYLIPNDSNGREDVFVLDRATCALERVSVTSEGWESFANCGDPSISGDGVYVAFDSHAALAPGDNNGWSDIYVHNRNDRTTRRASLALAGAPNSSSFGASISGDGQRVAYYSTASNLTPGDTNGALDVFLHDLTSNATLLVSVGMGGVPANAGSRYPCISPDGRFVAFVSEASNLTPDADLPGGDIFLRDVDVGTTIKVSKTLSGAPAGGSSTFPAVSADGRFVVYQSTSSVLAPDNPAGRWNVFLFDRETGATERISVDTNGGPANGDSEEPRISADGRYIVFQSAARDLVDDDASSWQDVFLHDRELDTMTLVSVDSTGVQANARSGGPDVSSDGRVIAFSSLASSLYPQDYNNVNDVYYRHIVSFNACPGDTNGDNVIDFQDLIAVISAFNTVAADPNDNPAADIDADGDVDFADLNVVVSSFNSAC